MPAPGSLGAKAAAAARRRRRGGQAHNFGRRIALVAAAAIGAALSVEQSRGLNPFAEAMRAHPDGTMGPVGTVDLLNIPGQHPDAYSNRIWHHYVTREPGAFDRHDVFAKNRSLLRIFPPSESSGGLRSEADEL